MAKDAKGHGGSEARGGGARNPHDGGPLVPGYTSPGAMRLQAVMRANNNPPIVEVPAHGTGVAQIGTPPLNRSAVLGAYNRNENNNAHSENIALLAKHFGTPEEHSMAREIISERNRIGQLPDSTKSVPNVRDWQNSISKNYYPRLHGNRK